MYEGTKYEATPCKVAAACVVRTLLDLGRLAKKLSTGMACSNSSPPDQQCFRNPEARTSKAESGVESVQNYAKSYE